MRCAVVLCALIVGQAQEVTDTVTVDAGRGRQEQLRKINGRWFSQDNREVNPPPPGGHIWTLESAPGVVQFFHQRPFQLSRAEPLHLWMPEADVQTALGEPNCIFGADGHAFWYYYAPSGIELVVRFMGDGAGEAKYCDVQSKCKSVESIAQELNGRNIYQLSAQRASQRVQEKWTAHKPQFRSARNQIVSVESVDPVQPAEAGSPDHRRYARRSCHALGQASFPIFQQRRRRYS